MPDGHPIKDLLTNQGTTTAGEAFNYRNAQYIKT